MPSSLISTDPARAGAADALARPAAPGAALPPSPATRKRARRAFIDLARGFAVVCMIEHHSFDAFMPDSFHGTPLDHFFRFMGGVAAPTFLFLAGVAMVMMMEGGLARGLTVRASALAAAKRGGWIFIGAYLFRFQEWALAGGVSPAWTMLRIDVLNCIGLALMLTALLWGAGAALDHVGEGARVRPVRARALLFLAACALIVLTAPIIWERDLSALPQLLFDYLRGVPPRALFPIFPWIAYSFAGALLGLHLAKIRASPARDPLIAERNALALWLAIATPLWFVILYVDALPFHVYAQLEWWRTSPAYFLLRCISMIWLLCAAWLIEQAWQPVRAKMHWVRPGPLVALGQHSLVIYWVHIEIVYGRLTWPVRGTMSLLQASSYLAVIFATMIALAYVIDPALDAAKALLRRAGARLRGPVVSSS